MPEAVCNDKEDELARVKAFSCNCQYYNGGPCYKQFSIDFVMNRRLEMKSLTEGMQIQNYCYAVKYSMKQNLWLYFTF